MRIRQTKAIKVRQMQVKAIYADILETLQISQVPSVFRQIANDPDVLSTTWNRVKQTISGPPLSSPHARVIVAGISVTTYN